MASDTDRMEKIVALAKRRGFIFPSSEIYGGLNGFWDYGPLGVELKRNIKAAWWDDLVRRPPTGPDGEPIEMVGLDCSIIMNPKVWEASGHVGGFSDPMVDDKETKERFRADHLYGVWIVAPQEDLGKIAPPLGNTLAHGPGGRDIAVGGLRQALEDGRFFPPSATVIASSEGEALDEVMRNCRPRWNVKSEVRLGRTGKTADITFEDKKGNVAWAFVRPISPEFLAQHHTELPSPYSGETGVLTQPRHFNLMFQTHYGAVYDESHKTYLRPETAQGIFANFRNVLDTQRLKLPFGIAQIGKAFRNEINPRNYTFRSREFEQMEIEFFCRPDAAPRWYTWWRDARFQWYVDYGLTSDRLRLRDHEEDELAHYAAACADVEYDFPFGVSELEGIANRTDFDLKAHQDHSGRDMTYFDEEAWQRDAHQYRPEHYGGDKKAAKQAAAEAKAGPPYRFIPYVIEPSGGVDRAALAFLCEAYDEDEAPDEKGNAQQRTVLRLHPRLAPVKVAVFPLVKKDGMPEKARAIYEACREEMTAFYDEKGAVGRRYRRQDEAGTPFCVTVDGQTAEDGTVTVRDRDTMEQVRVPGEGVVGWLKDRLGRA